MRVRLITAIIISFFLFIGNANAWQNSNLIYGKVTGIDGQEYTGFIKWCDGSFLWCHILDADKTNNPYYEYVPDNKKTVRKTIYSNDGQARIISRNYYNPSIHIFETRFGNIKSIEVDEDGEVYVQLKEGKYLPVRNHFKDIGKSFYVLDSNMGRVKIEWNRFKKIEFMPAPEGADYGDLAPIYGTVNSSQGIYTGFISWDRDEKKLEDKLDGKYNGDDVAVKFKNIVSITKTGNACDLLLVNKQRIRLSGSNDVNLSNRGLYVYMPNTGRVYIKWRNFISLDIKSSEQEAGITYNDFKPVERLKGTVVLNDSTTYKGVIVYDLDEAMDAEILQGAIYGFEYKLPFKYIESIEREGYDLSRVKLKGGPTLILGSSADVNYKNDGVLVFMSSSDYRFFYWDEVAKIVFE